MEPHSVSEYPWSTMINATQGNFYEQLNIMEEYGEEVYVNNYYSPSSMGQCKFGENGIHGDFYNSYGYDYTQPPPTQEEDANARLERKIIAYMEELTSSFERQDEPSKLQDESIKRLADQLVELANKLVGKVRGTSITDEMEDGHLKGNFEMTRT